MEKSTDNSFNLDEENWNTP